MGHTDDWTPEEMPALDDRTVVVTGANSGIGFEAARHLARKGAYVVLACRSLARGREAETTIAESVEGAELELMELDLASLESIRTFASEFRERHESLDILVNNAGVMALPYGRTEDGFERQFGINHLGHFALTGRLLESLRRAPASRVVTVSSGAHRFGEMVFEDLHWESRDYDKWGAYGQSKLANLLFAFELERRLDRDDDVMSLACHPGYAATELQRKGPEAENAPLKKTFFEWANRLIAQSAEQGSWPTLYAATSPHVMGGEYIGPSGLFEMTGSPCEVKPRSKARDPEWARRLWEISEEMTGVSYDL